MSTRWPTVLTLVVVVLMFLPACRSDSGGARDRGNASTGYRIPVILDTDTGNDIDDTFAIAMLLRSPRFDVKLITTTDGQGDHRAALVAKVLAAAGRTDIPIAKGPGPRDGTDKLTPWLNGFDLAAYKGRIEDDAAQSIVDTIHRSPRPVTVIAIGPLQTLAAALDRDPSIVNNANLVGMQGSVFKGYNGSPDPQPEFNVKRSIPSAQKVLSAPWRHVAITPLDTCGLPQIRLTGPQLDTLRQSPAPLARAILAAHAAWSKVPTPADLKQTSLLYDTVAVYLADPDHRPLLITRPLNITVTDTGMTIPDPTGAPMTVATDWTDVAAYPQYLVHVLTTTP